MIILSSNFYSALGVSPETGIPKLNGTWLYPQFGAYRSEKEQDRAEKSNLEKMLFIRFNVRKGRVENCIHCLTPTMPKLVFVDD